MSFHPQNQLEPKSQSISEVFESTYFEIPYNQREYRWEKEQLEKIWDDLLATVEDDIDSNTKKPIGHFLGAIVVIGQPQSHDKARWEIIDGQQRTTTITILAACFKHFLTLVKDQRTHRRLQHVLDDCTCSVKANYAPRVILNREDDFYQNSLLINETKPEKEAYWNSNYNKKSEVQKNIKYAFEYFYKKIEETINLAYPEQKEEKIANLIDALTENFYFLVVRTENFLMAYKLFETLNERGLDLSQADLIKNMLLQHASENGEKALNRVLTSWNSLTDIYEDQTRRKLDLPQIIQFSFAYRHGKVKKEKIFEAVAKELRKGNTQALGFANEFFQDAVNWRAFLHGELPEEEKLESYQNAIIDPLWKSHCAPFIFAAMDSFSEDAENLEICLYLTENYLFRQGLIAKDSVSSLQEFFTEAASMLRSGLDLREVSAFFKKNSPDDIYKEHFKKAIISNTKQGLYIISKIEQHISNKVEKEHNYVLEYILPKKPDNCWGDIESIDEFSHYIHRIGNLIRIPSTVAKKLLGKSFADKTKISSTDNYNFSPTPLTKQLISNTSHWTTELKWNFQSIDKRQEDIAEKYATNVWPL